MVFGYDPMTPPGVLDAMTALAEVAGADRSALARVELRARLDRLTEVASSRARRTAVLLLEWTDPPYAAGHWIPDQVAAAGGQAVLGRLG